MLRPRTDRRVDTKKHQSVDEVRAHYDLSDEFFQLFTDPTVTYSCAYFPRDDMTMEEAQIAKLDLSLGKLGLKPGMTLLDVGCGWGSMMKRAMERYDVNVIGVTLSKNQHAYCQKLLAGVDTDRSYKVLLQDWAEVKRARRPDRHDRGARALRIRALRRLLQVCLRPHARRRRDDGALDHAG